MKGKNMKQEKQKLKDTIDNFKQDYEMKIYNLELEKDQLMEDINNLKDGCDNTEKYLNKRIKELEYIIEIQKKYIQLLEDYHKLINNIL